MSKRALGGAGGPSKAPRIQVRGHGDPDPAVTAATAADAVPPVSYEPALPVPEAHVPVVIVQVSADSEDVVLAVRVAPLVLTPTCMPVWHFTISVYMSVVCGGQGPPTFEVHRVLSRGVS